MNYKIQNHPAMTVAGYRTRVKMSEASAVIPGLWNNLPKENYDELEKLNDRPPRGKIGGEQMVGDTELDYYIGVATEAEEIPAGMETLSVEPGTWAVVEAIGPIPGSIQAVWQELRQGFTHEEYVWAAGKPDLEVYPDGDTQAEDYKCFVWVPLKPHWAEDKV